MRGFVLTAGLVVILSGTCLSVFGSDERSEVRNWNGFQITFKGLNTVGRANELEIKELSTGRTLFPLESEDLEAGHYHCCEYVQGNLYVIKRTGDDSGESKQWTNELWRFQSAGEARKLYEAQGLDFRVSPKGDLIAVSHDHKIVFLDPSGKLAHETLFPPVATDMECDKFGASFIGLGTQNSKWSKDGSEFWGAIECLYVTPLFYKIAVPSWELATYRRGTSRKEAEKGWPFSELVLDPESGKVAFSNYPFVFDEDTAKEIKRSRKKFHLSVQDLKTGLVQRIATSVGKEFKPKWVDANLLEYDNPTGDKRVRLNIDPGYVAGIDCDKDNSHAGRLICADPMLLEQDYEISYLYQALLSASSDIQGAERSRLAWIGDRDKCRDGRCIEKVSQKRRKDLERQLNNLRLSKKEVPVTEEYFEESEVYIDSTNGSKEPLGKYQCCARVETSSTVSLIDFFIKLPDSEQILQARVPAVKDKAGVLVFRFVDGWGNWGKGSFKSEGEKGLLRIEAVKPTDDFTGHNVLRQYGEQSLSKVKPGTCSK